MFELYEGAGKKWSTETAYWLDFIQTFNEEKGKNAKLTITNFMENWHAKSLSSIAAYKNLGAQEAYKKGITDYWKTRETAVLRLVEARDPKKGITDEKIIKELMQLGKIDKNQAIKIIRQAKTVTIRNGQSSKIKLRPKTKYGPVLKNIRNSAKKTITKRRII
ncbi:MAG: hypothetical protein COT90_00265 [Candidatus Diapherotrites archaeon CG10_big_fil_rev_8_21_14_0_10_31_34]|nr:MAG: hypothetical protein COT90_00265 [Candidatus Diapherotrites archaeon CG10_big_fil_rev_8_21_14_0_10_31_34]